jgi:hypothetical protein
MTADKRAVLVRQLTPSDKPAEYRGSAPNHSLESLTLRSYCSRVIGTLLTIKYREAISESEKVLRAMPGSNLGLTELAYCLAAGGRKHERFFSVWRINGGEISSQLITSLSFTLLSTSQTKLGTICKKPIRSGIGR